MAHTGPVGGGGDPQGFIWAGGLDGTGIYTHSPIYARSEEFEKPNHRKFPKNVGKIWRDEMTIPSKIKVGGLYFGVEREKKPSARFVRVWAELRKLATDKD